MAILKVLVGPKVDLDTCGTLLCAVLGTYPRPLIMDLQIEVCRTGHASEADLADPSVLCIEVGGSGRVEEGNFDHHEAGGPTASATLQALAFYEHALGVILQSVEGDEEYDRNIAVDLHINLGDLIKLVMYIDQLDTEGPQSFGARKEGFYLSDLFSGMLLTERDPAKQVRNGFVLLLESLERGWDPFEPLDDERFDEDLHPEWVRWLKAKVENNRLLAETIERASWGETGSGRRLAWLESNFFGAPGALYGHGAEIAVVFNPRFGNPPVWKFTVAGNSVVVTPALERLNALESGWGGPATGTILGSPREGSSLTLEQVVEVVRETL